ncbi:MAG: hypothetical protein V3R80_09600 [Candidatus Tectomicrobia bacterium]
MSLHSVTWAGIIGMTIAYHFCVEVIWKSAVVTPPQTVQDGSDARPLTR